MDESRDPVDESFDQGQKRSSGWGNESEPQIQVKNKITIKKQDVNSGVGIGTVRVQSTQPELSLPYADKSVDSAPMVLGKKPKSSQQQGKPLSKQAKVTMTEKLEIDSQTMEFLRDSFWKFLPRDPNQDQNNIHQQEDLLDPAYMKAMYERIGLDKEYPSMFAMVSWMVEADNQTGNSGLTFPQFVEQACFFFSQRNHEEGLRYIFKLFDLDDSGYLDIEQFTELCGKCGCSLSASQIDYIFQQASGDGTRLDFKDFSCLMIDQQTAG